jgi:NTP pyrophosphatase (non-canonical NTP hydrolase)
MEMSRFQELMHETFGERDAVRGIPVSVAWLAEEIGELAQALRKGTKEQQRHEFSDVLAWLASIANQAGIDLAEAMTRFTHGCPKCEAKPCSC